MKKENVVQGWVTNLSWKEQTVLLCGLRGPDFGATEEVKQITRWIRSVVLHNAAPEKPFMKEKTFERIKLLAEQKTFCLDFLTVHFFSHLVETFKIIAYRHPDKDVSTKALLAYKDLCEHMNLHPETKEEMTKRLLDEV